ncbi:cardiolipin synthase [Paenibacillus terrigena]|uniref:cardiolipin synthase n=1 Tax=Paenibacillus terrigena TaxID=369333 RepID=UPI00037EB258|nr:cardiolipin synthase [Paenibacillus terrigena]
MNRILKLLIFILVCVMFVYSSIGLFGYTVPAAVSISTSLTVIFIGLIIFMENRHPSSTMAWILLLALLPVVGFVFYLIFGQTYRSKRRKYVEKGMQNQEAYQHYKQQILRNEEEIKDYCENQQKMFRLSLKLAKSTISFSGSSTEVLTNGKKTFDALIRELELAQHHIHMEYYIFRNDHIGTQIKDILVQKARAGVEVRFLYDAVGSYQLPSSFLQEMRNAGIEVMSFMPVKFPTFSNKLNYRNHRKIVVIDGNVGFMGGLNVGDEYLSRSKTYGFWRDTHMIIKGQAVRSLQIIFMQDWQYMTGKSFMLPEYFSPAEVESTPGAVQIIPSGPDSEWTTMKSLFFSMITSAKESIWMATPYFIPDEDILSALRIAALSGIEVRILFPAKPDKWLPFLASHSYFSGLIDAGVEIYEYERGFLHSKLMIIDGETASIGTANMDMRSFHLNYEVNALLVRTASVQRMVQDFERDMTFASRIDSKKFANKKVVVRFLESAARLFSPLL